MKHLKLITLSILLATSVFSQENTALLCADGIDNDGDGFADCEDLECIQLGDNGCATCFNDAMSFADTVIFYQNTCENNTQTDSLKAIGVSDHSSSNIGYVSLGDEGVLILQFKDNVLINSGNADPDLWIFEVGTLVEATDIELHPLTESSESILINEGIPDNDGDGYYEFGQVAGATASIDIDANLTLTYAAGSLLFDAVKLIDVPGDCSTNTPGADIDAVCALSSLSPSPREEFAEECADGIDNDGDGFIDCEDTSCQSLPNSGCTICKDNGTSFADEVRNYSNTCPSNLYTNSAFALGVSDYSENVASFVSLGEGGSIELDFTNNKLTNSGNSDADLWVFEVGPLVESTSVALLPLDQATINILENEGLLDSNGDGYYEIDTIQGSTRSVDIDQFLGNFYAGGTLVFESVQLTDVPEDCGNEESPGADIDAVCALFSIQTLPVELSRFSVRLRGENEAILSWKTVQEVDNSHFDVERSVDARNFSRIGQIDGLGTSSSGKSNQFLDRELSPGSYYYRIRQVDYSGQYQFSDLVTINVGERLKIFPNPTTEYIYIEGLSDASVVKLFNRQGKLLVSHIDKKHINMRTFPSGIYHVQVISRNKITVQKIAKY
ncbi:T9SS type A sorting domain-containing protein [Portibacter marinus]|uniref:T9SS type A sorting domain-containing protein n=1 Tax=Portibacter marinus TaxID=2898660 RepID=UPI001F412BB5|nr:T9SS type A sorting domain-containing protein [Portibacter marinus]